MKKITIDEIQKDKLLHDKIARQISKRYTDSDTFMEKKRVLFNKWYEKFTNPAESASQKVKIHMLFQHLKAFISTYYEEGLSVSILGREFLDDDFAYMLETCAKYDYTLMNKKQKDFFHIMNIGFYGVSILLKKQYDSLNDIPKYEVVSPEYRLPDPNGNILRGFRYHMFDFSINKSEIDAINKESKTGPIYFNVDSYQQIKEGKKEIDDDKKEARALGIGVDDVDYNGTRVFLEREGRKYICDIFNKQSLIGRREEIKPVDSVEEKNPSLIPFPVEIVNAFPLENDPCGMGLAELVLDFQNAKNRLVNLSLRKEEWNAGFKVLLADVSKIQDIDLLAEKPTDGPIIVPFNGDLGKLGGDIVRPVMDGIQADQSTINLANILDIEAQTNTGYTSSNRGLPFGPDITLGQAKIQQVNSNLIFSLDSECISWGEVNFFKNIWYRSLKENLPSTKKKYARIGNGLASVEVEISGKDIREHNDPDIVVESKKSAAEKNKQKLDYMLAREAIVMQNPSIPAISKLIYQRDIEKYRGISREEIYLKYPRTTDEMRAIRYIKMINADINPESLFYDGMDLWTYYIYLQKAKDSKLKKDILLKIEELMIAEGINKVQQPTGQGGFEQLSNSMASQLTSNVAQQSGTVNNYPTRADVLSS